jgi:hypothetical protein
MAKIYDSRFDVTFNPTKNEVELKKSESGKYCAEDAQKVWELVCSRKKPLSKWSFYIAGFNQSLGTDVAAFDPTKATAWLKKAGEVTISIAIGKWGKPILRIDPTTKTTNKASDVEIW